MAEKKKESLISNGTTCEVVLSGVVVFFILRFISPLPIYSGSTSREQRMGVRTVPVEFSIQLNSSVVFKLFPEFHQKASYEGNVSNAIGIPTWLILQCVYIRNNSAPEIL